MNNMFEEVKECLVAASGQSLDDLTEDSTLESLGFDSLDLVEVAMELESHFDCCIPDKVIDEAKTVGDIVKQIRQKIASRA